jgi:CRP-like cAMP-binding protein
MQERNTPCEQCLSRKLSMFSGLSEENLCSLTRTKNLITHKKGQILYYEGTKPMGVFCISSGVVKTFKIASNGKEQIIRLAKKGDFLGYTALLGEETYSCTTTIVEDANVCFIPKETFLDLIAKDRNFHTRLTKAICHDLGVMEEQLTDATQKTIRERLAFTLLKLSESYGIEGDNSQKIDIVLTREEIAALVGTATETVIRLLSEFKKDKLITFEGKKIVVHNKSGLAKLADFYS